MRQLSISTCVVPVEEQELRQVRVLVEESDVGLGTHPLYSPVVMGGQHRGQRHPLAACNFQQLERMEL